MGCSISCWRRRGGDSEDEEPAKHQILPRKSQKSSLPNVQPVPTTIKESTLSDPRLMSPQASPQTSPPATQQSPPQNSQLLLLPDPINPIIPSKPGLIPTHDSSVPSETIETGGFFANLPRRLKLGSLGQRKSTVFGPENQATSAATQAAESATSNRSSSSSPKVHARDPSTERALKLHAPIFRVSRTSLPHTVDQKGGSPAQVSAQSTIMSGPNSSRSHEAGLSTSWIEIPDYTLRRMDVNKFPFQLVPPPDFRASASVEIAEGYPAIVTTLLAQSYLMTTIPPYAVKYHRPNRVQRIKTIYYELQDVPEEWGPDGNIWFGFSRINALGRPGTGPGSIGINRNDGGLYYNSVRIGNRQNFDFNSGAKIGIGLVFLYVDQKSDSDSDSYSDSNSTIEVRVIHTRQGVLIDNERVETLFRDVRDCFDGDHDLFAKVGTLDRVVFEATFEEKDWMFKPRENGF